MVAVGVTYWETMRYKLNLESMFLVVFFDLELF